MESGNISKRELERNMDKVIEELKFVLEKSNNSEVQRNIENTIEKNEEGVENNDVSMISKAVEEVKDEINEIKEDLNKEISEEGDVKSFQIFEARIRNRKYKSGRKSSRSKRKSKRSGGKCTSV